MDTKIRPLNRIKGINILCMAFYNSESEKSTGEIVFATNNGSISLYSIEIREEIIESIKPGVIVIPTTVSEIQSV